jgi:uncharacterized protein (TIGR03435 family)
MRHSKWRSAILLAATGARLFSQSSTPAFEVASVRAIPQDTKTWAIRQVNPARYRSQTNVMQLVTWAWNVKNYQILEAPGWLSQERFEIEATTAHQSGVDEERLMVQKVLQDRFGLKLHHDNREFPVYALVVGKGGPKMAAATGYDQLRGRGLNVESGVLVSRGGTMVELVDFLTTNLDRPALDKTNLTGRYDFTLAWDQASVPADGGNWAPVGPALFTAIRDLGLRLEPQKASVEVLVIDSVVHPSEN